MFIIQTKVKLLKLDCIQSILFATLAMQVQ